MSVYSSGFFSEQTMRRPLRFFRDPEVVSGGVSEEVESPRRHRDASPSTIHAVLHRRHMNPIAVTHLRAFVESAMPTSTAARTRPVLGVAVVRADDITEEERADAATYFEPVAPDGTAWMEGLALPSQPTRTTGNTIQGKSYPKKHEACCTTRDSSCTQDAWLSSREASEQQPGELGTLQNTADAAEWPAFASCGAGKVTRSHKRKKAAAALHDTPFTESSRLRPQSGSPQPARVRGPCNIALQPHVSRSTSRRVPSRKRASKRPKKHVDDATIVFSDPCVEALPDSVIAAFSNAFQPEPHGVVVRAVLPRRPRQSEAAAPQATTEAARFHRRTSSRLSAVAAHALAVVNATATATEGRMRSVLDQAVVLHSDAVDAQTQRYALEAKTCQRPRFRRRTSMEVYGRGYYVAAQ